MRGTIKISIDGSAQAARDFAVQAEFAQREGAAVLTRLAPGS